MAKIYIVLNNTKSYLQVGARVPRQVVGMNAHQQPHHAHAAAMSPILAETQGPLAGDLPNDLAQSLHILQALLRTSCLDPARSRGYVSPRRSTSMVIPNSWHTAESTAAAAPPMKMLVSL